MDEELRRRLRKLESGNKKNAIENRRLARENVELIARLEKLEKAIPETAALAAANEKLLQRVYTAVVKVVKAIKTMRTRLAAGSPEAAKKARAVARKTNVAATHRR